MAKIYVDFVQSLDFPDFEKDQNLVAMLDHMADWQINHFWTLLKLYFAGFTNIKYVYHPFEYKTFNDTICMEINHN